MSFTPKDWKDSPDATTPISASALEDLETRVTGYADTVAAAVSAALTALTARIQTVRAFNPGVFTASQTRDITISWPVAFADTNYAATFAIHDAAGTANNSAARQIQGAKTVNGITIRIAAGTAGYSSGQLLIDAIAVHD